MAHDSPLIGILVFGLGLAFVFGTIANRLKLSPLVGYLVAGIAIGPFTPGFVADSKLTLELADIGVILLMFGVGLHFSPKDLMSVRRIVIPGALLQVAIAASLGCSAALWFGWPVGAGIVFGLALSVASTVVMMRALQERRLMDSDRGRVAVGWLVMQDLITVIALVLLPPLAGALSGGAALDPAALAVSLALTFGKLALFAALMFVVGGRVIPWILHYIAHTGSRELFRLAVLAIALGVAFAAAELFGVSIALGAFFGGMILSESPLSQRAAEESLPLRDAFAVLFFVSVGMVFDPLTLVRESSPLAVTVLVVLIGSGGAAFLIARLFRQSWATALLIGAGVAQIGEFSFILADLGIGLNLMPERARDLILGTSIITIFINPLLFAAASRLRNRLEPQPQPEQKHAREIVPTTLTDHVVLVGYGRVGRLIAEGVRREGLALLVMEDADDAIAALCAAGIEIIAGNAASDPVLAAANLKAARILFVAIPEAFEAGQIVEQARRMNPDLEIVARAHFDAEVEHLQNLGATRVIMGEREIAQAMLSYAKARSSGT
ncbi:MAG TPA: YbaL family putative K(+) efflux transporter [Rhizomicrobium sp.]|nr:YbaL family putative K(+) efflux transporter [Rhizomicrobium sp.]